ncbi:hypothetical protein K7432_004739 [Basidiobolus ranarum]|uniref:SCP domain-containing protein n=1 Tax=Basidiobolus ranarum TaxID=34480 RepID=A0ABR2W470_9FUNG
MKSWITLICLTFLLLQAIQAITGPEDVSFTQHPNRRQRKGKIFPVSATVSENGDLQKMLALVNQQRQQNGGEPLKLDINLVQAAQKHTDYQARVGQMTHDEPGRPLSTRVTETGFKWSAIGENVAMGYTSIDLVMEGWMNSAGHRQNILNPQFTSFGSGYVANGNYWTQVFGA